MAHSSGASRLALPQRAAQPGGGGVLAAAAPLSAGAAGGVGLFGGRGTVWMALGGVALLSILDKSLQLLGLSLFLVLSIKGLVILSAAGLDMVRRRGKRT